MSLDALAIQLIPRPQSEELTSFRTAPLAASHFVSVVTCRMRPGPAWLASLENGSPIEEEQSNAYVIRLRREHSRAKPRFSAAYSSRSPNYAREEAASCDLRGRASAQLSAGRKEVARRLR